RRAELLPERERGPRRAGLPAGVFPFRLGRQTIPPRLPVLPVQGGELVAELLGVAPGHVVHREAAGVQILHLLPAPPTRCRVWSRRPPARGGASGPTRTVSGSRWSPQMLSCSRATQLSRRPGESRSGLSGRTIIRCMTGPFQKSALPVWSVAGL